MNYTIITGSSKGLGRAISEKLIHRGHSLFCISRTRSKYLIDLALEKNSKLNYYEFDLSHIDKIEELTEEIFNSIDLKNCDCINLINNAGVVDPVRPVSRCNSQEVIYNLHVNLVAPLLLITLFIKKTNYFRGTKRIINLSSGASKTPYPSWSYYCSSKAGIDMFTRCVGLEQKGVDLPVEILSFTPGKMDTIMQEKLRNTTAEDFPLLDQFIQFKINNQLLKPEFVAEKIIELLHSDKFEQGGTLDVREM